MQNINRKHIFLASAFILLFAAPACFADLMCYVCDDCAKVSKETPLLTCNEDFFNQGGSTEASTITTTTGSTVVTTDPVTESSTETEPSSTLATDTSTVASTTTSVETTTTEQSSTITESTGTTESTEAPIPTPATVGPPETTTGLPTPPYEGLFRQANTTRLLPAAELASTTDLPIRQRRALIDTSVSYHCYTVQKSVNNTMITERGCSRVEPLQSVCDELKVQNNNTQLSQCDPCTMNACNGASSLVQSSLLAVLLLGVVAAALQRN